MSHAMTSSEIFEEGLFMGLRYSRMEDQNPGPGIARNKGKSKNFS